MIRKYFMLLILILCFSTVAAGCASVNSNPFVKFHSAVQEASTGIDTAMSVNYDWTRSGFVEDFCANTESKFSQLIIRPGEKYDWSMGKPPIYLDVKKTRAALSDLNYAFTQYASLLVKLSGGELASIDTFDQLTKDLNKNAADAAKALKVSVSSNDMALFSTAASEAARLYIEHKRQDYLIDAINKNQENVQRYSNLCIELIHTIRGNMKAYYVEKYEPIKNAWNTSSSEKRHKQTEAMLNLNEQFTTAMGVLQELEGAYRAIPNANADLSRAIKDTKLDLEGVQQLYSSGKRLQRLYSELQKMDKND
jgi:hypothetical protein